VNESFMQSLQNLYKRYPHYRPLFSRVIKKLKQGDREGAMKTLNASISIIPLCSGNLDIKEDIYKVLKEEQKK